jgi:hypothetical protein
MADKARYFGHRWPRLLGFEPVSADVRTGLCSRARIPRGKGLARPETGRVFFGDTCQFQAVETARSRVSGGKAAESQRLFRPRQETGIAQDYAVELAGLEPATKTAMPRKRSEALLPQIQIDLSAHNRRLQSLSLNVAELIHGD